MSDRTAIRTDIVARLIAAGVAAGNVLDGEILAAEDADLPRVEVNVGPQRFERIGDAPPSFRVETEIVILLQERQATDADPEIAAGLDTLIDAAIAALFNDAAWVVQWEKILAVEVTPVFDESGARPMGAASLAITVQYSAEFPPTVADALTDIHAEIDMASPRNDPQSPAGPDGQIDATDDITLPQ